MAAFGDWAQNYYDSGYSVLPVHPSSKMCNLTDWTEKFSHKFPSIEDQAHYANRYSEFDIGIATGKISNIVAIDFDYDSMADSKAIESLVLGVLPPTQCIKKGAKGWTRFYRFDESVKNMGIDRFGVRMIDVLSTGRLTVLPPSNHKNEGITYKWIGGVELLDCEPDDMEVITSRDIDSLVDIAAYDNSIFQKFDLAKSSRHDTVVGFILRASDDADSMEDLVRRTCEFDVKKNKDARGGPYLSDEKYLKGKKPYEFAKDLCERVCKWKTKSKKSQGLDWDIGKYPRLHAEGKKSSTNYDDFRSFFEFSYPSLRYDKIKCTAYYYEKRLKRWEPIENIIPVIESQASEVGLSPGYVSRHLLRYIQGLEPRLTIDIQRWSGRDVLGEMVSRLNVTNIPMEHVIALWKEWGANIFRRLSDTHRSQQNAMIILKGGQGIGKDSFINYMFRGLDSYFSEIEIQDRKIENYQTVADLLVANIPEFDETHRVSISTLKSLITSAGATFRSAYARKSRFVPFYVSYISSCNFDHILRDSSGNRRFMIFELNKIKWDYRSIDQAQILAQFHHLYRVDYKAPRAAHDAMKAYIVSQTPGNMDDYIADDINAMLKKSETYSSGNLLRWTDIVEDCEKLSKRYRCSMRRIQSIMKSYGIYKRDSKTGYYKSTDKYYSQETYQPRPQ